MTASDHIPVTVLTGFLGSGKTTVLNHLLRQKELNGVVAIINEFGEVALDHLLVESSEDRLALLVNRLQPGDTVVLTLIRAGQTLQVAVVLGEWPDSLGSSLG